MTLVPGVVVEADGQRQNAPPDDVRVHPIRFVGLRIALESLQVRGREEGEAVLPQCTVRKEVHHLDQGTVEQLGIEDAVTDEVRVNLGVWSAAERNGHVSGVLECDLVDIGLAPHRELLIVRQPGLHQVCRKALDLPVGRPRRHRDRCCNMAVSLSSTASSRSST